MVLRAKCNEVLFGNRDYSLGQQTERNVGIHGNLVALIFIIKGQRWIEYKHVYAHAVQRKTSEIK